jgi:hypothetical protein
MVEATILSLVLGAVFALFVGADAGVGLTLLWQHRFERDRGRDRSDRRH